MVSLDLAHETERNVVDPVEPLLRSDSLSRKVQQNATETPEPQASTSASGAADEGESKDTENTDSKAWKWKHEYYSTLVHL